MYLLMVCQSGSLSYCGRMLKSHGELGMVTIGMKFSCPVNCGRVYKCRGGKLGFCSSLPMRKLSFLDQSWIQPFTEHLSFFLLGSTTLHVLVSKLES